jgi:hypothetical protein
MSDAMKIMAISAAGLVLLLAWLTAPPAHAAPCTQWAFAGKTTFDQANGWATQFESKDQVAQGPAQAYRTGSSINIYEMYGTVTGAIEGQAVNVRVQWSGGQLGIYEGSVNADGSASGTTYDAQNPSSRATWNIYKPFTCLRREVRTDQIGQP